MSLARGERRQERLLGRVVTFEGGAGPDYDLTDAELIKLLQQPGGEVAIGTRVRISHYDDVRRWFEVVKVVDVVDRRELPVRPVPAPTAAVA